MLHLDTLLPTVTVLMNVLLSVVVDVVVVAGGSQHRMQEAMCYGH